MELLEQALTQGIAPAIVVAIYLIVIRIIDTKKDKHQIKISTELTQSMTTISQYIINVTKGIVDKDKKKCEIAIDNAINSAALSFIQFLERTLLQNHINENKENILSNIHNIANSEYYNIYSVLNLYEINGIHISEFLDKDWIRDIEIDLTNVIFNSNLSNEAKIIDFTDKVTLKFNSYITRITNKMMK